MNESVGKLLLRLTLFASGLVHGAEFFKGSTTSSGGTRSHELKETDDEHPTGDEESERGICLT